MTWTLAQAKDKLSEVVRQAVDQGPQTISVRGKNTAVVISSVEYETLRNSTPKPDFVEFLLSFPKVEELDVTRDPSPARDFSF